MVERVDAVSAEQQQGIDGERAAAALRRSARRALRLRVTHLCRVAAFAAKADPTIDGHFTPPPHGLSNRDFHTSIKLLLQEAAAHRVALIQAGLGETLLTECQAAITTFEHEGEEATAARRRHVLASATLRELAHTAMQSVGLLDGLNSARFSEAPGELAEWQSARRVERAGRRAGGGVEARPVTNDQ